jgi:hypothetical protein
MLLAPYGGGFGENCNITGNTKTMAAACTSRGHRIVVSVCREPSSPALSRICLCFQPGTEIRIAGTESIIVSNSMASAYSTVVGAHGGSVLVQIPSKEDYSKPTAFDYFVYTNAAAPRIPHGRRPCIFSHLTLHRRPRSGGGGWTRCWMYVPPAFCAAARPSSWWRSSRCRCHRTEDDDAEAIRRLPMAAEAELLLFRNGKWRVKRPFVVHCHGSDGDLLLSKWWLLARRALAA